MPRRARAPPSTNTISPADSQPPSSRQSDSDPGPESNSDAEVAAQAADAINAYPLREEDISEESTTEEYEIGSYPLREGDVGWESDEDTGG